MSAAEFSFWLAYRKRVGFAADRLEHVAAQSGAYVGGSWGGDAHPRDLTFKGDAPEKRGDPRLLMIYLKSMPNVKVRTHGRR